MAWDKRYREELAEYNRTIQRGRERDIEFAKKQHERGSLTARERLQKLFDQGIFHEIDAYEESEAVDFGMHKKKVYGDGVITGWGHVHGQLVYVASQDISAMGGSLGKVHGEKICRLQEMAYKNRCPIVFVMDSGGARVEEGVAALSGYSSIFKQNTKCSGVIPQIALLLGYSVGGSSYLPAMCDFTFMTRTTSKMFITGPGVVKEVIGEEISADELGGSKVHSEISGATDFVYENDEEVIDGFRKFFTYICQINTNDNIEVKDRCGQIEEIVSDDQRKVYDVRKVIDVIVDTGSFFESKERYATNIVIGFARLDGKTIGIVANQPLVLGGSLDAKAAEKAARFIRFCDCFDIPLLTLVDTPGFFPGKKQEEEGIIRRGAKLLYAYAEATVPKVTLVMRKAYGGAYIAMNSKNIGADFVYAWPIAQLAVLGAEGAVNVVFRKQIANAENPEQEREECIKQFKEKFMNPYYAARQGYLDEVILPEKTRSILVETFLALENKNTDLNLDKKHGNISL